MSFNYVCVVILSENIAFWILAVQSQSLEVIAG